MFLQELRAQGNAAEDNMLFPKPDAKLNWIKTLTKTMDGNENLVLVWVGGVY